MCKPKDQTSFKTIGPFDWLHSGVLDDAMKQIQCLRQTFYGRPVEVPSMERLGRIKATYNTFDRKNCPESTTP